jgi:hypothetical protein
LIFFANFADVLCVLCGSEPLHLAEKIKPLGRQNADRVNPRLLSLQAICHLFRVFHLPSAPELPSIHIESRPAGLVMAVTDF